MKVGGAAVLDEELERLKSVVLRRLHEKQSREALTGQELPTAAPETHLGVTETVPSPLGGKLVDPEVNEGQAQNAKPPFESARDKGYAANDERDGHLRLSRRIKRWLVYVRDMLGKILRG